jgi:hypothetical protein
MGGALLVAAMAVGTLAMAGNPAMGAGAAPAAPATGLPLPSLPPPPPVPLPTLPAPPPPVVKPPAPPVTPPAPVAPPPAQPGGGAAPPPAAAPPAAATPPGGAAPAPAGSVATPVPGSGTASTAGDPGADLYPQPPVDPATTPQARLVARLGDAQQRVRYLQAVLTRTRADLAVAQRQLGPAGPLRALLTGATAPATGSAPRGSVDTPDGRVLALSSAVTSGEAELARRQAEALVLQRQVNDSVEQAMAVAKAAPVPPNATTYTGGRLLRPLAGPITSLFGNRQDPYYHVWQLHAGVDLGAPAGTAIHAAAPGRVTQAGWSGGYGNYTCIDHGQVDGQRLSTCYAHQQRILVTPGQQVGAGDVIGQVGSTGASTGPHLHFEVRLGGRPVDPMPWI